MAFMDETAAKSATVTNAVAHDDGYLDTFPQGYRFCPYDDELITHYLKNKVLKRELPINRIREVDLYQHNPEYLTETYKSYGEREWYFFTPRDKKYRNGNRPNRAAGNGYWKATGADKTIYSKRGEKIGYRKALVFYVGKPPKGDKSNWIMHEYRVHDSPQCTDKGANGMRLDEWVLCRIYKKTDRLPRGVHLLMKDENESPYDNWISPYAEDNGLTSTDSITLSTFLDGMEDFNGWNNPCYSLQQSFPAYFPEPNHVLTDNSSYMANMGLEYENPNLSYMSNMGLEYENPNLSYMSNMGLEYENPNFSYMSNMGFEYEDPANLVTQTYSMPQMSSTPNMHGTYTTEVMKDYCWSSEEELYSWLLSQVGMYNQPCNFHSPVEDIMLTNTVPNLPSKQYPFEDTLPVLQRPPCQVLPPDDTLPDYPLLPPTTKQV